MRDYKKWTAEQRNKSLSQTRVARRMGIIPPPSRCCFCGQEKGIIHYHNVDYDVSLRIQPKLIAGNATNEEKEELMSVLKQVCWRCHMMLHKEERHPKSAEKYFEAIKNGVRYTPVYRGNAWEELDQFMID